MKATNICLWCCCVIYLATITLVGCGSERTAELEKREATLAEAEATAAKSEARVADPKPPATPIRISDDAFRAAAYEGKSDVVGKAIESGTDVNAADPVKSLTALHMAAYNGHSDVVKLLLEHDAVVDCRDVEGKTPLIHACTGPFAKTVEILLDAGAELNATESTESFTPLMMAAGLGQVDVVKLLLARDADKTILDEDNDLAIDHARNSGHAEIVKLLE